MLPSSEKIAKYGWSSVSPEEKQGVLDMVIGATSVPRVGRLDVREAKQLASALSKPINEMVNPVENTQRVYQLAQELGIKIKNGKLVKSTEQLLKEIVTAPKRKMPVSEEPFSLKKIDLGGNIDAAKRFIQDKVSGQMRGRR